MRAPLLLCLGLIAAVSAQADPQRGIAGPFLAADAISWKVNEFQVARWKTLVGGIEGGQIEAEDVQFGLWELAPRAIYHGHKHLAPEIYFIVDGTARWTVGSQSQVVEAGATIYTKPGEIHRMENLTDLPLRAIWLWWAPGGDTSVFKGPYEFTEPAPRQPEAGRFGEPAERRF